MENEKPKLTRRERYKGSYPKEFKQKYKEQQPNIYTMDVAKIIEKGRTPAGMHISICVNEILDFLEIKPGQVGLDATLGYGGHSLEMLKCLLPKGQLYATDIDPIELPRTQKRLAELGYGEDVLKIRKMNFSGIDKIVEESGLLNFILADLGVSSMQIDNPERGFSLKFDGPLDLRLNPKKGKAAAELLKNISVEKLENILIENADEPNFEIIANTIIQNIKNGIAIETTLALKNTITEALNTLPYLITKDDVKKTCQRCFQALRIEVNDEFGALNQFLQKIPDALLPNGKVAILSFHSGEDRRVKKAFQTFYRSGVFSAIASGPIIPSMQECFNNKRARSAKLRWAIKA